MSTTSAPSGDSARVEVQVAVQPAVAFEVFTKEIDRWWRRGPRFRFGGRQSGKLYFEPRAGGRLFESFGEGPNARVFEAGRVTLWEPPTRLVFNWRHLNFAPDETTEVEVPFEAIGNGTRVTVEHRGWASLRRGHPARHGLLGPAHCRELGLWWSELMSAMRDFAAERK